MEGYCPPHYSDMRAAVDAVCERKFGPGGPFHPDTPGPWKNSSKVYIHLQDPLKVVKDILVESDNNWNLTKAFNKIDYKISIFDSWEDYENQKS